MGEDDRGVLRRWWVENLFGVVTQIAGGELSSDGGVSTISVGDEADRLLACLSASLGDGRQDGFFESFGRQAEGGISQMNAAKVPGSIHFDGDLMARRCFGVA